MSDPYASDGPPPTPSPDASGLYFEATITYDSSIDPAVTGLTAYVTWDLGVAAAHPGAVPVMPLVHGYTGNRDSIGDVDRKLYAALGVLVVTVGLRGNNGAGGARDAGGREDYDIEDAVAAVRATYPLVASQTVAVATGYSGGGGNVAQSVVRFPDRYSVAVLFFPVWSYANWYDYQPDQAPDLLDADLGGSPAAFPALYAARESADALAILMVNMGSASPFVELFYDLQDIVLDPETHIAFVAGLVSRGVSTDHYRRVQTDIGDSPRAYHDYPASQTDLRTFLDYFGPRIRAATAVTMPAQGTIEILGWVEWGPWSIWLSSAADARATGGLDRTASLVYDTTAGTCTITPRLGTTHIYVRHGADSIEFTASDTVEVNVAAGTVDRIASDMPAPPVAMSAPPVASGPSSLASSRTPTPPVSWFSVM